MKKDGKIGPAENAPLDGSRSSVRYLRTMAVWVLRFELLLLAVSLLSFLFTGGLSWVALSDRLFWLSLIPISLGVFGILAVITAGASTNPGRVFKPEQARLLMDNFVKSRQSVDARYDFCILMWVSGMLCIGLSALVQLIGDHL
ncbi:MAG: hypothetical protein ACOYYS_24955 [Chloroflexota bacterium]